MGTTYESNEMTATPTPLSKLSERLRGDPTSPWQDGSVRAAIGIACRTGPERSERHGRWSRWAALEPILLAADRVRERARGLDRLRPEDRRPAYRH